jgi:hypothetical protein
VPDFEVNQILTKFSSTKSASTEKYIYFSPFLGARMAQLELEMDNNERMVLRINNEELLPILEALQRALSRVKVEHV